MLEMQSVLIDLAFHCYLVLSGLFLLLEYLETNTQKKEERKSALLLQSLNDY